MCYIVFLQFIGIVNNHFVLLHPIRGRQGYLLIIYGE